MHAFHINCILSQKETETEIAYLIVMSDLFGAVDGVSTRLQKKDLEQPYAVGLVILSASPFLIRLENKVQRPV